MSTFLVAKDSTSPDLSVGGVGRTYLVRHLFSTGQRLVLLLSLLIFLDCSETGLPLLSLFACVEHDVGAIDVEDLAR